MTVVVVTGFFDGLHHGHDQFLRTAAEYGDRLIVVLGSDAASMHQKGKLPAYSTSERTFMLGNHPSVDNVIVPEDMGPESFRIGFEGHADDSKIVFVINTDGHSESKQSLCEQLGIEYVVLDRTPPENLPATSSTDLRAEREKGIPYRINIGGFVDQPYIGQVASKPVSVIVLPIWSDVALDRRSGLATSTRDQLVRLNRWVQPVASKEIERLLFAFENPPGYDYLSGSMDAIGLTTHAVIRISYDGDFWPCEREEITAPEALTWIEQHLFLYQTGRRPDGLLSTMPKAPPHDTELQALGSAVDAAWTAIQTRDTASLGASLRLTFEAVQRIVPNFAPAELCEQVENLNARSHGCCPLGAGGGGYLLVAADDCPEGCQSFRASTD
ncbi:MAG: hypothetical protein CMJ78_20705 [Planctomycetaceae bacterium]|nr:hypothetical protein [Planctomycetaceae bacterium]